MFGIEASIEWKLYKLEIAALQEAAAQSAEHELTGYVAWRTELAKAAAELRARSDANATFLRGRTAQMAKIDAEYRELIEPAERKRQEHTRLTMATDMDRDELHRRLRALDGWLVEWTAIWNSWQTARAAVWAEQSPVPAISAATEELRRQPAMLLTELTVAAIHTARDRARVTAVLDVALPVLVACACLFFPLRGWVMSLI